MNKQVIYKIWKLVGVTLPLLVVITMLLWVSFTKNVNAFWFNDQWKFRQKVNIGAISTQLENYQIQITAINTQSLYNAGKIQADCQDIRFTDIEGRLLEYWIEDDGTTCQNDTSTDIWVKTSRLVTGGTTTLYMYYGNPSAVAYQNPYNTFDFFEEFSASTLDSSKWQSSGSPTISSGRLLLNNGQTVSSYYQTSVNSRIVMRASQPVTGLDTAIMGLSNAAIASAFTADDSVGYQFDATTGANFEVIMSNDATTASDNTSLAENAVDNEFELSWTATAINYFINNVQQGGTVSVTHIANEPLNVRMQNSSSANTLSVDWVAITKHATSMPATITFDSEEKGNAPLLFYDFEEISGTTVYDKSGSSNGAINNGGVITDNCVSGNCFVADGVDDHIVVPNESLFDFERTQPFAICTWVNPHQVTSTSHTLVSKLTSLNVGWELTLYDGASSSDGILVYIISAWPGNRVTVTYDNVITPNRWHHICMSYSGNSSATGVSVYLNGKLLNPSATVSTLTGSILNNESVRIGSRVASALPADAYIDEVKIFPRALTSSDVLRQYNTYGNVFGKEVNVIRNGLVGWWRLDEGVFTGTAGEVKDSSGLGFNGTRSGDTFITAGKFGNGASFDGTTDFITTSARVIDNAPYTYCAWVKPTTVTPATIKYILANGGETGAGNGIAMVLDTTGEYKVYVSSASGRGGRVATAATTTDWTHICGQWDGTETNGSIKIYINSQLANTLTPSAVAVGGDQSFSIARPTTTTQYSWSGQIDDVRVYNRILSQDEINSIYSYTALPIQHWKLDEQSGTVGASNVVGGTDLTLTNMEDVDWKIGKKGNALDFDGSNEFATAGNLIANPLRHFTFSWWMNIDSFTHGSYMASFCQAQGVYPSSLNNFCFYSSNTGSSFGLQGKWSDGSALDARTTIPFSTGTWKMVTVTYDGSTLTQYVNGAPINSVAYSGKSISNANTFVLGRGYAYPGNLTTTYFDGKIDDFKIYNYALSHNQVYSEYIGDIRLASENQSIGAGLIAHWKMDELSWNGTSGEIKDTVGSNNATAFSGASPIAGKIGNAGNFNGTSYAQSNNNIGITGSQPRSISFWFNQTSMTNRNVVGFGTNSFGNLFDVLLYNGELVGHFWGSGQDTIGSGSAYSAGVWNHGVITYDGSVVIIYLNGQLGGQKTISLDTGASAFRIGAGMYSSGYNTFNGQVDDVRVYNKALNLQEIQDLYNLKPVNSVLAVSTEKTTSTTPLVHFKLDEKTGTTTSNIGSSATNGTLNNFGTSQWRVGKIGSGLLFDGSNDYVSLADSASFNWSNQLTVTTWFKSGSVAAAKSLVAKTGDGTAYEFHLSLEPDGRVRCWVSSNGSSVSTMTYSQAINYTDNQWHFASCVYNGSNIQVQVDGRVGTAVAFTGNLHNGAQPVTLGGNPAWTGSWMYAGMLDNVKIWNTALSQRDLMIEYTQGRPSYWWNFDRGEGMVSPDIAGSANGTMLNITPSSAWQSSGNCKLNGCITLDGTNDYISHSSVYLGNDYSVSGWFKTTAPNTGGGDIFTATNGSSLHGILIEIDGGTLRYLHRVPFGNLGGQDLFSPITTYNNGQWHHFVATMQAGTSMNLYIDGRLVATTTPSGVFNQSVNVTIGRLSQTANSRYYNGSIDEIKVFPYALSATDVKVDYNLGAALRFE